MRVSYHGLAVLTIGTLISSANGVIPLAEITTSKVLGTTTVIYGALSSFGGSLNEEKDAQFTRLVKPTNGLDGCNPIPPVLKGIQGFYLLVSRGNCTFLEKTIAAQTAGASGVLVYNSLESIYQGNKVASEVDYDCDNGSGYVDEVLTPVYGEAMDALMPTACTTSSSLGHKVSVYVLSVSLK
jgi:PA domain